MATLLKRYALFAGRDYDWTAGGWDDFFDSYDSIAEASLAGIESRQDWWHVVDLHTGEKVVE